MSFWYNIDTKPKTVRGFAMPRLKASKQQLTFRLDDTTFQKTKIVAQKEERVLNSQLEYWIKKSLEQYENENGTISLEHE